MKLKYPIIKPSSTKYRPLSDRGILSDFKLHKTIVPVSQAYSNTTAASKACELTKAEIIMNLRDVDSKQDKRFFENTTAYYERINRKKPNSTKAHKIPRKTYHSSFNRSYRNSISQFKESKETNTNDGNGFFITESNDNKNEQKIPSLENSIGPDTKKMLRDLPKICTNFRSEFVEKGKTTSHTFKLKMPKKKIVKKIISKVCLVNHK